MATPSQKYYNNASMHKKCMDIIRNEKSDVNFIFEIENDVIKIPANRDVLAASSPVFNIMFNGDLKEEGDVEIVDASPTGFEEFLQFFYGYQVKPTMENIAEVLKLADKYDVAGCFPVCSDFLKDNLTTDDILWGLYLAIKYKIDDLEAFCKHKIDANFKEVKEMLDFNKCEERKLSTKSSRLSATELELILPQLFAISMSLFTEQFDQINQLRRKCVFPITLANSEVIHGDHCIKKNETITFSLNGSMLLTDIHCSEVRLEDCIRDYIRKNVDFKICIKEQLPDAYPKTLFEQALFVNAEEVYIKLSKPITIKPNYNYTITMQHSDSDDLYTYPALIPDFPVKLTRNIAISFPKEGVPYKYSLITCLEFMEIFQE